MSNVRLTRPSSHLGRLDRVWIRDPIYFITLCSIRRQKILGNEAAHKILRLELETSAEKYGWWVGRYVVMPDHLHLFCAARDDLTAKSIEIFLGKFKEWSAKRFHRELGVVPPFWQPEFFDHILRSNESYLQKSEYLLANPLRAGLVARSEDWPFAGEITEL